MKRALILASTFPYPPKSGEDIRIYNILRHLAFYQIDFVTSSTQKVAPQHVDTLRNLCNDIHVIRISGSRLLAALQVMISPKPYRAAKFNNRGFKKRVELALRANTYDLIWCNYLNTSEYLEPDLTKAAYKVLDLPNDDEGYWTTFSQNSKNALIRWLAKKNILNIRRFRQAQVEKFDLVFAVSKSDKEMIRNWLPDSIKIQVLPNGVDMEYFQASDPDLISSNEPAIIFCGLMDAAMNVEAVDIILKQIFPKVKNTIGSAKLYVVGRNPPRSLLQHASDSVIFTGAVDDVRSYYRRARVSVAPIKMGGGTKLKILEAMAMGLPVVSTSLGAMGIEGLGPSNICIQDSWEDFSEAVIRLLSDDEQREELGRNGRALVEERYSWETIFSHLKPPLKHSLS